MSETSLELCARTAVEACRPASAIGQLLLDRYVDVLACDSEPELARLRELCRMVEDTPFTTLSVRALEEAGAAPRPTQTARGRRREVASRLRRLLQSTGELPSSSELSLDARTMRAIASAPASGRATLARWHESRKHHLSAFELRHEIRHLARLENVLAEHGPLSENALIQLWLRHTVRQIVACRCAPVTRAIDPHRCNCCGATPATHGTRPSPGPAKQHRLEQVARRYLAFRRAPVPTRQLP